MKPLLLMTEIHHEYKNRAYNAYSRDRNDTDFFK